MPSVLYQWPNFLPLSPTSSRIAVSWHMDTWRCVWRTLLHVHERACVWPYFRSQLKLASTPLPYNHSAVSPQIICPEMAFTITTNNLHEIKPSGLVRWSRSVSGILYTLFHTLFSLVSFGFRWLLWPSLLSLSFSNSKYWPLCWEQEGPSPHNQEC